MFNLSSLISKEILARYPKMSKDQMFSWCIFFLLPFPRISEFLAPFPKMSKDQMIWHRAVSVEPSPEERRKRRKEEKREKKKQRISKDQMIWHLAVSAEPLSPPTVENLTAIGVCFPTWEVMKMMSGISLMIMTHKGGVQKIKMEI